MQVRPDPTRWVFCSIAAVWLIIGATLGHMLIDPPTIIWDGFDEESGLPTGGMATPKPDHGMILVGASVVCLIVAAVLTRRVPPREG